MTKPNWKYISPGSLATSGIYSEQDLAELRDHIMFPAERPAMLNTLARGMMGQPTAMHGGGSFANFLDEAAVEKIALSAWTKFWSRFLIFGNVSAGFIGIYLIVRATKLILDTIVHGYALHTVYGWSVYLIGAFWDSLTNLLLHLGVTKNVPGEKQETPMHNQATTHPVAPEQTELKTLYPSVPSTDKEVTFSLELPRRNSHDYIQSTHKQNY